MRIEYKKYKIKNNKKTNIKIVHISDIHFSHAYKTKRLDMLKNKINEIKPNYICITGDLIDIYDVVNDTNFHEFKRWLNELSKISKIIISIGNHEYIKMTETGYTKTENIDWLKKLKNDNIIILDNDMYNDKNITFIGFNPNYDYYYNKKEKNPEINNIELSKLITKDNKNYKILLLHAPSVVLKNNNYKKIENFKTIDLILSGHTHGGLIPSFIPGNFGIISPCREIFPKRVRGTMNLEKTKIIISSGVMKLSRKSKITCINDIYGSNLNEIIIEDPIN